MRLSYCFLLLVLFFIIVSAGVCMAVEINIGTNNTVNTGTISGDGCKHGSGKIVRQEREVEPFHAVVIDGAFTVEITGGSEFGLVVSGEDNLLEHIETRVADGRLQISANGSYCSTHAMVIQLTTKMLDQISADGATDITADLHDLQLTDMSVALNGTCTMRSRGSAAQLHVHLQGTAELDATEFKSTIVNVTARDATVAKLSVAQILKGVSSDASAIYYLGTPQLEVDIQDVSEVSPLE